MPSVIIKHNDSLRIMCRHIAVCLVQCIVISWTLLHSFIAFLVLLS